MPGVDEEATGWFFYHCFPPYVITPFQKQKIIKSQDSGNLRSEKNS